MRIHELLAENQNVSLSPFYFLFFNFTPPVCYHRQSKFSFTPTITEKQSEKVCLFSSAKGGNILIGRKRAKAKKDDLCYIYIHISQIEMIT